MREEGVVRSIAGGMAVVESVASDACASCGARGACHSLGGERARMVTARNQAGAREGDRVLLAIPRRSALGAGFLVYLGPVLATIAGAALGKRLFQDWGGDPQAGAIVLALAFLAGSWLALRWLSPRLARRKGFTVRIVRVLQKGDTDAVDQCASGV
jgi:sigma-E factor negative regulatory protein RseC